MLSILNSKLIGWYHANTSPKANKGMFPKVLIRDIRNIPLPTISNKAMEFLKALSNQCLSLKQSDPTADISKLEQKIDVIVYKLYNLSNDEINIIENKKND